MNAICPICFEDNNEINEDVSEYCQICIKNNCKIHEDCKKHLEKLNLSFEDLEKLTNNKEIGFVYKDLDQWKK